MTRIIFRVIFFLLLQVNKAENDFRFQLSVVIPLAEQVKILGNWKCTNLISWKPAFFGVVGPENSSTGVGSKCRISSIMERSSLKASTHLQNNRNKTNRIILQENMLNLI